MGFILLKYGNTRIVLVHNVKLPTTHHFMCILIRKCAPCIEIRLQIHTVTVSSSHPSALNSAKGRCEPGGIDLVVPSKFRDSCGKLRCTIGKASGFARKRARSCIIVLLYKHCLDQQFEPGSSEPLGCCSN